MCINGLSMSVQACMLGKLDTCNYLLRLIEMFFACRLVTLLVLLANCCAAVERPNLIVTKNYASLELHVVKGLHQAHKAMRAEETAKNMG